MEKKHIALCPNPLRDRELATTLRAAGLLESAGYRTVVYPMLPREAADGAAGAEGCSVDDTLRNASLVVAFGGDGTMLRTARAVMRLGIPILGVNLGHKGFMAELSADDDSLLLKAAAGDFEVIRRMMIDVELYREGERTYADTALNDAVLTGTATMIRVAAYGDGSKITEFSGDGLIAATPTGSTAYSLSAGGPLVEPAARNILLTPICAHLMSARPFVLAPERVVRIVPEGNAGRSLLLSVDGGRPIPVENGDELIIKKSSFNTLTAHVSDKSFYDISYDKLGGRA